VSLLNTYCAVCMCTALQFSQALADLETAQSQMTEHVKSHTDVVKQVQHGLSISVDHCQSYSIEPVHVILVAQLCNGKGF